MRTEGTQTSTKGSAFPKETESYWTSDEYGPYIYLFTADGKLVQTIQPPAAILPFDKKGNLNFTANVDPATGRGANQGM